MSNGSRNEFGIKIWRLSLDGQKFLAPRAESRGRKANSKPLDSARGAEVKKLIHQGIIAKILNESAYASSFKIFNLR